MTIAASNAIRQSKYPQLKEGCISGASHRLLAPVVTILVVQVDVLLGRHFDVPEARPNG